MRCYVAIATDKHTYRSDRMDSFERLYMIAVGALIGSVMTWGSNYNNDVEQHYEEVITACEEYQPRHIRCEVFAAPVQKIFVDPTQTNVLPQQGDRS